tara:strand:+ start:606 stop:1454 length:849 start_codon:yes stop_codon:yes gene_type:complete
MGYASDAQRKAVHADKADGGKGHPDNKKTPATMTGKERRQKNRADVKKAKQGKSGKEKRQAARAERKKQRAEGKRGVKRTVKKVKETVEKVRDSRVGRAVEGTINTVNAVKSGNIKKAVEGVKKTASAFSMVDPITGMPTQTQMSNMPPQPSNVMGMSKPVFNPSTMAAANNMFGDMQMRQNAVSAPNTFPTPFNQNIIGEQTYEFEKDKNSGNYVAGLSLDGGSADPRDTKDRIVITPKQRRKMKRSGEMNNNYIEQMKTMAIKRDSVSQGKNFYSIKNKK